MRNLILSLLIGFTVVAVGCGANGEGEAKSDKKTAESGGGVDKGHPEGFLFDTLKSVTLDSVAGLEEGVIKPGGKVVFFIRYTNKTGRPIGGYATGFKIYSPDGAQWDTVVGDTTGTLGKTQLDLGLWITNTNITGSGADTIGFAGSKLQKDGVPLDFDDVCYTIEIGPIDTAHAGKTVCLDSTFYPPSGVWLWAGDGGHFRLVAGWDGPHCYKIAK